MKHFLTFDSYQEAFASYNTYDAIPSVYGTLLYETAEERVHLSCLESMGLVGYTQLRGHISRVSGTCFPFFSYFVSLNIVQIVKVCGGWGPNTHLLVHYVRD